MAPSTFIDAWLKARTASAMRAILSMPEMCVLKTCWPAFWSAYLPAARSVCRSPAFRFAAEQLEAAETALLAETSTSRTVQIAVARTHTRDYWLDVYGGVERGVVARRQARYLLAFATPGWIPDPQWRTFTVTSLVAEIRATNDFTAMPILADALQDEGCNNEEWLALMRDELQPWISGGGVLDSLR